MADVVTKTVTTNYDKSIPEEVDSLITNVAPTDTPFLTSIGQGAKVKTLHPEWLEDTLGDAGENAHVEGADSTAAAITPPALLDNRVQRLEKAFLISEDLEKTDKHGRKSEIKYQSGLKTKEMARDLEWNLINQTKQAGTTTLAAKMDGVLNFAGTGNTYDFDATPADTNHITEDILNDVLQAMWEQGADPDCVLAPPAQKRKISAFTQGGRLTINSSASEKSLKMTVRILETDFGIVTVLPERFIAPSVDATPDPDVYYDKLVVYEKGRLACATFRPLKREKLAKTGDAEKYRLTMSKMLKVRSKKCVGTITNLTRVQPEAA
jgi:uncharacterized protein YjhX (UPF0386 family)